MSNSDAHATKSSRPPLILSEESLTPMISEHALAAGEVPSDKLLQEVLGTMTDAVLVLGTNGKVLHCNAPFARMFGFSSQLGAGENFDAIKAAMAACHASAKHFELQWQELIEPSDFGWHQEWELTKPAPKILDVRRSPSKGYPESIIITLRDITEERSLQSALLQSHKMESLGMLAGGIAHDFNNLLTAITGNVNLAQQQLEKGDTEEVPSLLAVVADAARGGRELVRQLLTHARKNISCVQVTDLRDIIFDVRSLLKHSISPLILVEMQLPKQLWHVKVDRNSLQQVVLNLCVNAVDAMKGRPNSRLTIRAMNCNEVEYAGDYVCLQVKDNGPGISPEIQREIFEPFFTTKPQGQGTGLGLSLSSEIMKKLGGRIECESKPGKGATFTLFIPRSLEATKAKLREPDFTISKKNGGHERILVVDDDPLVLSVTTKLLGGAGYQVFTACDGVEALKWIENEDHEADLVILDIAMPRLSGLDAMSSIRQMKPNLPVVLCSGSLADPTAMKEVQGMLPNASICKPYEVAELFGTVRKVLDGKPAEVLTAA
jgi:two-component system, cell cycle sensor histidine kinase and response regulator CckA